MATQQQPDEHKGEPYGLHPDDVSELDFPVAMRGFDREAVKRKLKRVADAYERAAGFMALRPATAHD